MLEASFTLIRQSGNVIVLPPCDIRYTKSGIDSLIDQIKALDGETKVCMEHTGRYYEPMALWLSSAGISVSAVNPVLVKNFDTDESLRSPKTEKADARKPTRYTLDKWYSLPQYGLMDKIRNQLKTMNRQLTFYMDEKTAIKNNLIPF